MSGRAQSAPEPRGGSAAGGSAAMPGQPFRFYDNRQKYLAFVSTCNEQAVIARRAAQELAQVRPMPPALRIFDAGMGDATVLARLMRSSHRLFPTIPQLVVTKEISREDVRLGLERMAERFLEHPATVLVVTNLQYGEAARLLPRGTQSEAALNWQEVRLAGSSGDEYAEQIEALGATLDYGWEARPSLRTGNPVYVRPTVLVIYREDHRFLLDGVIPRPGRIFDSYDFVLASHAWRARTDVAHKVGRVLAPLVRSLAPGGRLLAIQSHGHDPGLSIVQGLWPGENPFQTDRHQLIAGLKSELGRDVREYACNAFTDERAVFRYEMRVLPSEIGERIGTSTLLAAWNAAIYVNQIEDERLDTVLQGNTYLEVTQSVLQRHRGLWFNDEAFVVTRRRP